MARVEYLSLIHIFTPFQWVSQDTIEELTKKQEFLQRELRTKNVQYNWNNPKAVSYTHLVLVARSLKMRVGEIELLPFGGAVRIESVFELNPANEIYICLLYTSRCV